MKAVADRFPIEEIVVEGLAAGLDHFIMRGPVERQLAAWEALVRAVEASPALRARLRESLIRIVAFKATLQVGPPAPPERLAPAFPWPAHQALAGVLRGRPDGHGEPVDQARRRLARDDLLSARRLPGSVHDVAHGTREDWPRRGWRWYALPRRRSQGVGVDHGMLNILIADQDRRFSTR